MNKKFSTLMAFALLAGSVSAQTAWNDAYRTYGTLSASQIATHNALDASGKFNNVTWKKGVNQILGDKYYQLEVTGKQLSVVENDPFVLVQDRDFKTGKIYLKAVKASEAPLNASLWTIKYDREEGQSGGKFTYVNKETGLALTFDHELAKGVELEKDKATSINELSGCTDEWYWYTVAKQKKDFEAVKVYADVHEGTGKKEGFVYLAVADETESKVKVVKNALAETNRSATGNKGTLLAATFVESAGDDLDEVDGSILSLQPVVANPIKMTAVDLNRQLDADACREKSFKFTYLKPDGKNTLNNTATAIDLEGDLFKGNTFVAEEKVIDIKGTTVKDLDAELFAAADMSLKELAAEEGSYSAEQNWSPITENWAVSQSLTNEWNAIESAEVAYEKEKTLSNANAVTKAVKTFYEAAVVKDGAYQSLISDVLVGYETLINDYDKKVEEATVLQSKVAPYNLRFNKLDTKEYFRVDTARYHEELQPETSPAVKFAIDEIGAKDNVYMQARYNFKVTYFPTNDSILIEPLNAAVQTNKEWNDGVLWKNSKATNEFIDVADLNTSDYRGATVSNTFCNDASTDYESKTVALSASEIQKDGKLHATVAKDARNEFQTRIALAYDFTYLTRGTVASDVYFINLHKTKQDGDTYRQNGVYIVDNMAGQVMYESQDMDQDFTLMPATQWVVEQLNCNQAAAEGTQYVKITNREYNNTIFEGQLYFMGKDGDNNLYRIIDRSYANGHTAGRFERQNITAATGVHGPELVFNYGDTVVFKAVPENATTTSEYLGYKKFEKDDLNNGIENNYALKYNSFLLDDLYLQSAKDKLSQSEQTENPTMYEIAEATLPNSTDGAIEREFGCTSEKAGAVQLKRTAYVIKVKDNNLIDNNKLYLAWVKNTADGQYYYGAKKKADIDECTDGTIKMAYFYLKADQINQANGDTCYVLVDVKKDLNTSLPADNWKELNNGWNRVVVPDGIGFARTGDLNDNPGDRASAFYMDKVVRNQYVDLKKDKELVLNSNIKLFNEANEYLFEDCGDASKVEERFGQQISKGLGYLAIENKTASTEHAAIYVDEVQVSAGTNMPQYIFGVGVDSISNGFKCATDIHGYWVNEEDAKAQEGEGNPAHYTTYAGYTAGRFLINLNDSIKEGNHDMLDLADKYKMQGKTRLAFVEGVHATTADGECVYLMKKGTALKSFMTIKDNSGETANSYIKKGYVLDYAALEKAVEAGNVAKYVLKSMDHEDFVFSLRKITDGTDNFLLESNAYNDDSKVGSFTGAWVQILNNVPVLAQFVNAGNHEGEVTSVEDLINHAQIFSLEPTTEEATANDEISTSEISVIAGNGDITIKGAAGKKVTITNVLGQTVASTVLSSDEAKVTTPAGVVVVAVEGEAAVKAIVK